MSCDAGKPMKTEELARWVEIQVPLGEYREDDPDLLPLAAERLRELQAEVQRLKAEADDMSFRLGYAEAEVQRLKARTWEQERDAAAAWIKRKICQYMEEGKSITPGSTTRKLWDEHVVALSCIGASIEKGEHWPGRETP